MATNRNLSITYNSYAIDGNNGRIPHAIVTNLDAFESAWVEFTFGVHGDPDAADPDDDFATKAAAAEAAFRVPFKDLTVVQFGETLVSLKQSDNTGLNALPTITKLEDGSGGIGARYRVRIEFERPADNTAGTDGDPLGHRDSSKDVSVAASERRTINVSGVFTAQGGTAARAKFDAAIDAFCQATLDAIDNTATWKLTGTPQSEEDRNNKTIQFRRTYIEFLDTAATSAVRIQSLKIARRITAPGDVGGARRLRIVDCAWSAEVDSSEAKTSALVGQWEAMLSHIIERVRIYSGGGAVAIVDETPEFDPDDNLVGGRVTCFVSTGSTLLEQSIEAALEDDWGEKLRASWGGHRLSKYRFLGAGSKRLTVSVTAKFEGAVQIKSIKHTDGGKALLARCGLNPDSFKGAGESVVHHSSAPRHRPVVYGKEGFQIQATEVQEVHVFEYYVPDTSGGSNQETPSAARGG